MNGNGKKKKKKVKKLLSAEELIAGLRRNRGHLPTAFSESEHKKRMKKKIARKW